MTTISRTLPPTLHWLVVSHPDGRRPTVIPRWGAEPDPPRLAAIPDSDAGDPSPIVTSDAA
jgi:hypothetical protein